jgi:glycosyltransferase involved in cell wall biosynthesis
MRIIYLHQYFATPAMPGGTRSYEMARRLVARGHTVDVLTTDRAADGATWRETVEAGIRVHWCAVPYSNRMSYPRRLWAFLEYCRLAARRAATLEADVIFASSTPLTIALPAVYAARKQSVPMIFEVRDLWPDTPVAVGALRSRFTIAAARWLERFAYRNAARIVALSPDMRAGVLAQGYPADHVTVIPNSSDVALFRVPQSHGQEIRRSQPWLGDRPLVVYTGALGIVNGVDYLARLAAVVVRRDPEIRFLVVGSGREEELVRQTAAELGVLDRNFFLWPMRPKTEIPAILSAADIATSTVIDRPALWANSANKVFDAFAAGRPVAINHEGWLADVIRQNGCGLVLDPHDLTAAADSLVGTLRDPEWLARARASSARLGEQDFSRDRLAALLESVLLDVVPPPAQWRKAA